MVKKAKKEKVSNETYTLGDLADQIDGTSELEVRKVVKEMADFFVTMPIGSKLRLPGVGIFQKVKTKPRMGRNPHTGEQIKIKSKVKIKCSISNGLKDM